MIKNKMNKKCNKCKLDKNITQFYKDRNLKSGFRGRCKKCVRDFDMKRIYKHTNNLTHRICNTCNLNKNISNYHKNKRGKDGYFPTCKLCQNEKRRYKRKNPKKTNYDDIYDKYKKYIVKQNRLNYKKKNVYTNVQLKIRKSIQRRLLYAIKNNIETSSINKYLDCSISYFKKWIESQFTDNMSWSNYGEWQYDHVKPCAFYDLTIDEELYKCFNWKNYQPLMKQDNYIKNNKINKKQILNHCFKANIYAYNNPIN